MAVALYDDTRLDATSLADAFDGVEADIEGGADLRLAPAVAQIAQHLGAGTGAWR